MNNILDNLNDKQQEAVISTEGRIRVIAGAGSGKTRVLAHRFAFLVNEVGINPSNILCMTFTNKAAQEMKIRISRMVYRGDVNDFICTIHGFCVKILRRDIYRLGCPKNFIILDMEDSKSLAKQVMSFYNVDRTQSSVKQFLNNVSEFKALAPERYISEYVISENRSSIDDMPMVVRFIFLQMKSFALDFNDIIYFALYLLKNFEDVRNYWQDKMNYVMVDEVQDCNGNDWNIIELISKKYNNLFVVGDPDQSIYEWRGANPGIFVNFKADKDIILNQNYRSTSNILNVANSIIANNSNRVPKDLFTKKTSNMAVIHFHGNDEDKESQWIVHKIKSLIEEGANYNDFAILYRASYLSRNIEQALLKNGIKYTIWGGVRFFERKEIKDALAYLRLIEFNDNMSFMRIVNTPSRRFGEKSLQRLIDLSEQDGLSLFDTLSEHKISFNKTAINQFVELIDKCRLLKDNISVSDLLDYILKASGLKEMYRLDGDEERLENISELMNSIIYYENIISEDSNISLSTYLQDISLYTNADYKEDDSTVKLMTIHQSKGLEFPYVFVIGMTEGILPNHRAIRERKKAAEEEERRLMYVAITRAEKGLFLTESEVPKHIIGPGKYPSRFFNEINDDLITIEGRIRRELKEGTCYLIKQLQEDLNDELHIKVGSKVQNRYFGVGKIIEIKNAVCLVAFGDDEKNQRYMHKRSLKLIIE